MASVAVVADISDRSSQKVMISILMEKLFMTGSMLNKFYVILKPTEKSRLPPEPVTDDDFSSLAVLPF